MNLIQTATQQLIVVMLSILEIKAKYYVFVPEEDADVNNKLSSCISYE